MLRIRLHTAARHPFYRALMRAAGGRAAAANYCAVAPRTMSDWVVGRCAPPLAVLRRASKRWRIPLPESKAEVYDDRERMRTIGRRGALAQIAKYGNPGTPEGRRRGGLRAIARLRTMETTAFIQRKSIRRPPRSTVLAEFIGALLGDGGMTRFQVTVATGTLTDGAYAAYIRRQFLHLFGVHATVKLRKKHTTTVTASSAALVEHLHALGVPIGHKVRQHVDVPLWIRSRPALLRACIRGLMDTDGSVYLDMHRYRHRVYRNMGLSFTSASAPLLQTVIGAFRAWGFHPTRNSWKHLLLRREPEIIRYFTEIGTSNPKHRRRFKEYQRM